jgi:hypothetical protein
MSGAVTSTFIATRIQAPDRIRLHGKLGAPEPLPEPELGRPIAVAVVGHHVVVRMTRRACYGFNRNASHCVE